MGADALADYLNEVQAEGLRSLDAVMGALGEAMTVIWQTATVQGGPVPHGLQNLLEEAQHMLASLAPPPGETTDLEGTREAAQGLVRAVAGPGGRVQSLTIPQIGGLPQANACGSSPNGHLGRIESIVSASERMKSALCCMLDSRSRSSLSWSMALNPDSCSERDCNSSKAVLRSGHRTSDSGPRGMPHRSVRECQAIAPSGATSSVGDTTFGRDQADAEVIDFEPLVQGGRPARPEPPARPERGHMSAVQHQRQYARRLQIDLVDDHLAGDDVDRVATRGPASHRRGGVAATSGLTSALAWRHPASAGAGALAGGLTTGLT